MGNCCKRASSSMVWDCLKSENNNTIIKRSSSMVFDESQGLIKVKKESLLDALRASCDANGTMKIKISKKELGEFLREIEKQNQMMMMKKKQKQVRRSDSYAEQVLLQLTKAREHAKHQHYDSDHRPRVHVLQTITEA
ncbi:unnamed protein product [Lupinus luteus]|uniref:Uncharacterized protein n=1 Tax=Lupinus luteus TaxID=3873 RepID=A0AAV1W737_LUPLU